jgi:hypothetical protein
MISSLIAKPRLLAHLFSYVMAIAGFLILIAFFLASSEAGNQFLLGLSRTRFVIGVVFAFLVVMHVLAVVVTSLPDDSRLPLEERFVHWVENHLLAVISVLSLSTLLLLGVILGFLPPTLNALNFLNSVRTRIGGFIVWLFLSNVLWLVLVRVLYQGQLHKNPSVQFIDRFIVLVCIFLFVFFSYEHLLFWMKAANQSRYSYWNLLADEFLRGNLYLSNPPTTHDLTLYMGKWYIPMPPIPAVLMLLLAFFIGGENINTSDFSIFLGALNAVFFFLILEQLSTRKWITVSRVGMFLWVALILYGTPHLWVGIRGVPGSSVRS